MSEFEKIGERLTTRQREKCAYAAILSEFGTGDIAGDKRYKHLVHRGVEALYAVAGEDALARIGDHMNLMELRAEGPIPEFSTPAIMYLDEIRQEGFLGRWPKPLTFLRKELEQCIES